MARGGMSVMVNLCKLALKAGACPLPNILVDAWPYVPVAVQLLGSLNTRVQEGVNDVKHLAQNELGRGTCGCVTQECGTAGWDWHL